MHPGASIGQVYLCCVPVDFRKQIDGLAALVESELDLNVFADKWLLEDFDLWANYPHKTLKYQSVM